MALETENFIIDLSRQLNLNNMNDAQRARLQDLKDKKVATKDEQSWVPGEKLPTITDKENGEYKYSTDTQKAPEAKDLEDLYKALVVIFRDLAADTDLSAEDPVKSFLADFYGPNKAVEPFEIKQPTTQNDAEDIAKYIETNLRDFVAFFARSGGTLKAKDLSGLAKKLRDGTYTTDAKAVKNLQTFVSSLSSFARYDDAEKLPGKDFPPCFGTAHNDKIVSFDFDTVNKIYDNTEELRIPPDLTPLQNGVNNLFRKLVTDEKLREKFSSKDSDGQITKWINKGLSKSNYKDLAPLYKDKKTFWKNAKEKLKKHYNDTLGKFKQKHNRHIYSTNARYIVAELIKKGVKPTDGTEKILGTLDAIKGNLPTPVKKQLDWCKETLSKFKDQDFFKNALRNGKQMNTLVMEIIKEAAHNGKKNEAKVLLEMLSVMRYTSTTSSMRDKLYKEEFVLFSDPKLSVNKDNKYIQWATKFLDKTIKFGTIAAFEITNFAKNKINERGLKFKKGAEKLDKRIKDSVEYKVNDRQAIMEELMGFWNAVNNSWVSKDYNLFKKHSTVQKAADQERKEKITIRLAGNNRDIDAKTEQEINVYEYIQRNNVGRAA